MSKLKELIENYAVDVEFPEVSGFEILETLDLRSEIARREQGLTEEERRMLEEADQRFLQNAHKFYVSVAAVADLAEMRRRAEAPPSHWWWYMDALVQVAV